MKRVFLFALLLLLAAGALAALEIERGRIRLVLHEDSARFSLYLTDPSVDSDGGREWVALFVAEDPRTSELALLEGNRVHRIGSSGTFEQLVEETSEGARFVWTSATLEIEQRFAFVRSVGSALADGVRVSVKVTNIGERAAVVAARYLFDTYLGEQSNVHIVTPIRDRIAREAQIQPSAAEPYWISTDEEAIVGLQQVVSGGSVTTPERVVVANWKRLSDSDWTFPVTPDRSFNLLPYSINDSAVLVSYPQAVIDPDQQYVVTTVLGGIAPEGFEQPAVTAEEATANPLLGALNDVIAEIDRLLASDTVSEADVRRVQGMLEEIKSERSGM